MVLLPGCPCCGCRPCPYCSPPCLSLTLEGFSGSGSDCNECDYLGDTTFILKRPTGFGWVYPTASGGGSNVAFSTIGINNRGEMLNIAQRVDGSYYVTEIPVSRAGTGYVDPSLSFSATGLIQCRPPDVTVSTNASGGITAVAVLDGGEYWPSNSCTYSSKAVCAACPPGAGYYKRELLASVSLGAESNSVSVVRRDWYDYGGGPRANDTVLVAATQPSVDEDGQAIVCDGFKFDSDHITQGCVGNGTLTVASADCSQQSAGYCDGVMPDQITLSLSGMGKFFGWQSQNGGSPGGIPTFCGETPDIIQRFTGTAAGIGGWRGCLSQQDGDAVLDLVGGGCGSWEYQGFLPQPPCASAWGEDCGGGLSVPVSVQIGPTGLNTTVSIAPPTRGGEAAAGEVTSVGGGAGGGSITGVAVTYGGSGYAAEVVLHEAPTLTASVSGGSGATLSVSLTPDGGTDRTKTWAVSSVSVTSPGSGYAYGAGVTFSLGSGDVGSGAWAYINTSRSEPTITASPPESGTGGALSVSLTKFSSWWSWPAKDAWRVNSVTVDAPGSGYTDGDSVVFSLGTNDKSEYGDEAQAIIRTTKSEPVVTAAVNSYGGGSGAVVSPTLQSGGGAWSVASVAVTDGGSGYSQWDEVTFSTTDTQASGANAYVGSVDENGAIQTINVYGGGSYYHDDGTIASVEVQQSGSYYHDGGEIESVTVEWGGSYYHENHTGTVEADTPAVFFRSSIGRNATAVGVVDTSLSSETFGQVTSVNITNGGEKYRTSGTGWMISIYCPAQHLETRWGDEVQPPADPDPKACVNYWSRWQPIYQRVSTHPCPTDLLSRSYPMFFVSGTSPFEPPGGPGLAAADYCVTTTAVGTYYGPVNVYTGNFFSFGNGQITCSLSAG